MTDLYSDDEVTRANTPESDIAASDIGLSKLSVYTFEKELYRENEVPDISYTSTYLSEQTAYGTT